MSSLSELKCPTCKTSSITGWHVNEYACLWCQNCRTYTEGPLATVTQQWIDGENFRTKDGRRLTPQEKTV